MSEMMNNKISEEQLNMVAGGNDGRGDGTFSVRDISPRWVRVTASSLNCRYWPNGDIAKVYERGHRLKVDGITTDGKRNSLWKDNPLGDDGNRDVHQNNKE